MIRKKHWWGEEAVIPETEANSEFTFKWRRVKWINKYGEHNTDPCIEELAEKEIPLRRKLLILIHSMENFFKELEKTDRKRDLFDEWERKNRMDFNEWFHDQSRRLQEELDGCSFEYARRSEYGWCL